jgi:halocarboxylic acid dehydrogenase DehI
MAFTRAYEEHEVSPELRHLFHEVGCTLDLPFVPTPFKLLAASPEYLRLMWSDLAPVARSKEFQVATLALQEIVHSTAVKGGWRFTDQMKALAAEHFTPQDVEVLSDFPGIFVRTLCAMALFTRLMQRGYAGGQRGRVGEGRQASALARTIRLQVPNERDAGLRVWLIYSDIKRTLGARNVMSMFRVLSPFPGYLAATWLEMKKTMQVPAFLRARDEINRRALALITGMPVRDHRAEGRQIPATEWREIEETIDGFARQLPALALAASVWHRSFPLTSTETVRSA